MITSLRTLLNNVLWIQLRGFKSYETCIASKVCQNPFLREWNELQLQLELEVRNLLGTHSNRVGFSN